MSDERDDLDPIFSSDAFPGRGMKVTMMLADYAQVADGKLNVLGGGWTWTGPQPSAFAIALIVDVPWHGTNQSHSFRLELIDLDGNPVVVPTPNGDGPLVIEGNFEVGRPPGVRTGSSQPFMAAINSTPTLIPPGGHYEWRLTIDGQGHEDWRLPFSTRAEDQTSLS